VLLFIGSQKKAERKSDKMKLFLQTFIEQMELFSHVFIEQIELYSYVFIAQMIVVTLMTMRLVFVTKGERKMAMSIAFVEIAIWAFTAGSVLNEVKENPGIAIAYALGYAAGSYLGSYIEEKLGIGTIEMKVIVKEHHGEELTEKLRDKGYGVTVTEGKGKDIARQVLVIFTNRKSEKKLKQEVVNIQKNAVIFTNDTKPLYGGYF
jgi:uncharacterized protein YebE (UPF0316 family)